jgi:hypothetical protein
MNSAEQYVGNGLWANVPGATSPENLQFVLSCARLQEQLNVHGDVAEIGVYLGRVFILLHLLSRSSENALAIDVFDDDEKNFDVTGGASNLTLFKQNVRNNVSADAVSRLQIIRGDSLYLNPSDIRTHMACKRLRILSIDGAHSWHHTASDLSLADALIQPGGIVLVDDITNSGWPGVMDGVARYLLLSERRRLFPFGIGRNKLWLTTPDYHDHYLKLALSDDANPVQPPYEKRVSEFFGTKVVGF